MGRGISISRKVQRVKTDKTQKGWLEPKGCYQERQEKTDGSRINVLEGGNCDRGGEKAPI